MVRDLVVAHTRAVKLPGVARTFEGLARQARDSHWPHEDYLYEVLSAEQTSRHESVIRQRLREARFPEVKTLDTFDFAAADGINATQVHTLARGEWVTAPENLILAGPIGTGKTHLAIALGVEATKQKRRVLFTRAADLVRQLLEARDARERVHLRGVEAIGRREVKGVERLHLREARLAQALADDRLVARGRLGAENLMEIVLVGPVGVPRLAGQGFKGAGHAGQLQHPRVGDDEIPHERGGAHAPTATSHSS